MRLPCERLEPPMSQMGQSRPVRASNGSVHARSARKADVEYLFQLRLAANNQEVGRWEAVAPRRSSSPRRRAG